MSPWLTASGRRIPTYFKAWAIIPTQTKDTPEEIERRAYMRGLAEWAANTGSRAMPTDYLYVIAKIDDTTRQGARPGRQLQVFSVIFFDPEQATPQERKAGKAVLHAN